MINKHFAIASALTTITMLLLSSGSPAAAQAAGPADWTTCTRSVLDTESIETGNTVKFCRIRANVLFGRTGIHAAPGQIFSIEAMGKSGLADDGPYITNANGEITIAPPVGSGAYLWFTDNASPIGLPPTVGMQKFPIGGTQLDSAPFGALVAGFSSVRNPTSLADFPSGFQIIGASGIVTAPSFGGYLWLAVNDINNEADNSGYYLVGIWF